MKPKTFPSIMQKQRICNKKQSITANVKRSQLFFSTIVDVLQVTRLEHDSLFFLGTKKVTENKIIFIDGSSRRYTTLENGSQT